MKNNIFFKKCKYRTEHASRILLITIIFFSSIDFSFATETKSETDETITAIKFFIRTIINENNIIIIINVNYYLTDKHIILDQRKI